MTGVDRGIPVRPPAGGASGYTVGVVWSSINAGGGVLLPFGLFIFFARHLAPEDVGVIVFASALVEIIKAFGLPGLYEALLQQPKGELAYHETAAAMLLLAGASLVVVYAGAIAILGHVMPGVGAHEWLLDMLGLRILLDLATVQPQAALARSLSYGRLAVRSIIANLGAGALGVLFVLYGQPLDGLACYQLGQSALIFLTTATGAGVCAWPRFSRPHMARMRREAVAASVVRLVAASNNYFDQIVVAAGIGSALVAYFNLAKRVEMTFITTASSFSGILFQPLFAIQDTEARGAALHRGLAVLGLVCGVPCVFFVVNAQAVVSLAFGARWQPAASMAALLAVGGFIRALGSVHGALMSVSGRNSQLMLITGVMAIIGILVVIAAGRFGSLAIGAGLVLKNIIDVGWKSIKTRDVMPAPLRTYAYWILTPIAIMTVSSWVFAILTRHALPLPGLPGEIIVLTVSGLGTALAGLACFGPTIVPINRVRAWLTGPSAMRGAAL